MAKAVKKTKKAAPKKVVTKRCAAKTAAGTQCKRMVKGGRSKYCSSHTRKKK